MARAHEQTRKAEYARGYEDGRRSKDADHAAVALRLIRLKFDGGSHENLSKIAQAIYPCATGWTCENSKGLRDRLIDLLGGVHEHHCDSGRGCACGDSRACGVGESTETITYDVLGNERHKAVCELRKLRERDVKIWNIEISIALGLDLDASNDNVCDRLIYLLGGDASDLQKSPIFEDSGNDDAGEITITDELRKFATDPLLGYASQELHVERITAIADRIDEQFGRICHQQETVLQETIERMADENLTVEDERDHLRRSLRQIAERAGVPHDRDLSEYSDEKIANAVIGQLGQTQQYVKSLEWVRDRRLPRIEAERDELKAKLDAIREALDDK